MTDTPPPLGHVVVIDDTVEVARLMARMLKTAGYAVDVAHDGQSGLDLVQRVVPDVVLLDVLMPGLDGFEVCRHLKANPATRLTPVVLITSLAGRGDRIQGIDAGADDFLSKPVDSLELLARVRSLVLLKRHIDDLENAEAVFLALALAVEARDPYTDGHCERLASSGAAVGLRLGLADADITALSRGGYLHDVGKISVPDSVLLKPGPLTPEERQVIMRHTNVGADLVSGLRSLRRVVPIILYHHERRDGTGYPDGRVGDDIPLLAQIIGVVDIFDALRTARPYRTPLTSRDALEYLADEVRRGHHRADLVEALTAASREGQLDRRSAKRN
jgi:putative two-component system response regulator